MVAEISRNSEASDQAERAARRKQQHNRKVSELKHVASLSKPDIGKQSGVDLGRPLAVERDQIEVERGRFIPNEPGNRFSEGVIGTRAQRVWAPDRLLKGENSAIKQHQHDAAVRYYDDFLLGEVGANRGQSRGGARLDPWARLPYSEMRAQRRQSWQMANAAVGSSFCSILTWCVLQETPRDRADIAPTVQAWAESQEWRTERAVGFLAGALEALAQHYGFSRKAKR